MPVFETTRVCGSFGTAKRLRRPSHGHGDCDQGNDTNPSTQVAPPRKLRCELQGLSSAVEIAHRSSAATPQRATRLQTPRLRAASP